MVKNIILCLNIIKIGYDVLHILKILPNYERFWNIMWNIKIFKSSKQNEIKYQIN